MSNLVRKNLTLAGVFAATILAFCIPLSHAQTVYKCVKDGKVGYYAQPPVGGGQCTQEELKVYEPKAEDVARQLEDMRRWKEKEIEEQNATNRARELRAQEIMAEAALRQARAAEEEQRRRLQEPPPVIGYPYSLPYWWGSSTGQIYLQPWFSGVPHPANDDLMRHGPPIFKPQFPLPGGHHPRPPAGTPSPPQRPLPAPTHPHPPAPPAGGIRWH